MSSRPVKPVIVMLGVSGTGKSALCNLLINDKNRRTFFESTSTKPAKRSLVNVVEKRLRNGQEVTLVDTEGYSSPDTSEQELLNELYQKVKTYSSVSRFILVLNSSESRFDQKFQNMINKYIEILGKEFLKSTSIVFTRWDYDKKAIRIREQQGITEFSRQQATNEFFSQKWGISSHIPCVFLDCNFEDDDPSAEKHINQLTELINSCTNSDPFATTDIKEPKIPINPILSYGYGDNSQYAQRMERRKGVISKVEVYYDNRDINQKQTLMNDLQKAQQSIIREDPNNWILVANFIAYMIIQLKTRHLVDYITHSLSDIVNKSLRPNPEVKFNVPKDCILGIEERSTRNFFFNLLFLGFFIVANLVGVLIIVFTSIGKWYIVIIVANAANVLVYLIYCRISWKKDQAIQEIALELTQVIAYEKKLKQITIEFVDSLLDKEQ